MCTSCFKYAGLVTVLLCKHLKKRTAFVWGLVERTEGVESIHGLPLYAETAAHICW
jgi:hypothetical protein